MSIRTLSPELAKKALDELNEDPKRVEADVRHLKEWIAKQPHLRARTDDQWLVAFLRGCKYSLERTKQKLDLYYSVRSLAKDLYQISHRDPKFDEILSLGSMLLLPKASAPDAPRVALVRPGQYNPDKYSILEIISVSNVLQKISLFEDDQATIAGTLTILDLDNVTMAHFLQMTPMTMKKMVVVSQDATPLRMKGTHYVNTPTGFETIFNAIKALLNEKNRNRLYVHNKNFEEMYKVIPKDILPSEYGGNGGTTEEIIAYWKNKVKEYRSFLDEDENFGVDESKRPGKPNTAEALFGTEGSFRQLEFD